MLITFLALAIGACASPDPYRAASSSGSGYSDEKLSEGRYRITFKMRGDDSTKATDYAMRRAVELTLLEGKEWFVVTSRTTQIEREKSTASVIRTPATVSRDCGVAGCKTRVNPGSTIALDAQPDREKIETYIEIRIGEGDKPDSTEVYDAQPVRSAY